MKKILMSLFAGLSLLATPALADSDGQNRSVRVANYSNTYHLVYVNARNEHGREYDALKGSAISPGYNRILSFDDGEGHGHCIFFVTARFSNGVTAQRSINVCTASTWKIADIDNSVE